MVTSSENNPEQPSWRWPLALTIIVLGLWLASWGLIANSLDKEDRGPFGDMFGAINALFSGLAFAGVIYANRLQRAELRLQKYELKLTRAELQGQKEQLSLQNDTLKRQNFESTFFQQLRLHNDIVN